MQSPKFKSHELMYVGWSWESLLSTMDGEKFDFFLAGAHAAIPI